MNPNERIQNLEDQVAKLTRELTQTKQELNDIRSALVEAKILPKVLYAYAELRGDSWMVASPTIIYHNPVDHMYHNHNVKRRGPDWWTELFNKFDEFTASNPDYTLIQMSRELRLHWPKTSKSYVYKRHHEYRQSKNAS